MNLKVPFARLQLPVVLVAGLFFFFMIGLPLQLASLPSRQGFPCQSMRSRCRLPLIQPR